MFYKHLCNFSVGEGDAGLDLCILARVPVFEGKKEKMAALRAVVQSGSGRALLNSPKCGQTVSRVGLLIYFTYVWYQNMCSAFS